MKKLKALIILLCFCLLISGCSEDIVVDKLYIPEGYKDKLETMKMTEIAPMPYFKSPFITITKDFEGKQYAVIFRENEEIEKVILPKTYESIVDIFETKGCKIEKYAQEFSNLQMFENNNKLYWYFSDEEKEIHLNLQGEEEDPFDKK